MARWPSVRVALIIAAGALGLAAISLINAMSGPGRAPPDAALALPGDAAPAPDAAPPPPPPWPELADRAIAAPWRVVDLPLADPDRPATIATRPLILGDLAIVGTSRAGFVAVDLPTATVAWARPAGPRVAPPAALGDHAVLVGDCATAPPPARGQVVLGCFDIVDPRRIADTQAGVVTGPARDLAPFATAVGDERTAITADGALIWRRGAIAIAVDLATGAARRLPAPPIDVVPHVDVDYHGDHWTYALDGDVLIGRFVSRSDPRARLVERWRFDARGAVMAGAFGATPPRVPIVRLAGGRGRRQPDRPTPGQRPPLPAFLLLLDIDAVAGELGQVSRAFPGERALATAFGDDGLTAVAVRLPETATRAAPAPRDYIALFDGNAAFLWAYPLPEPEASDRPAPGLAIDREMIVVVSDDRLTLVPVMPDSPTVAPGPS